MCCEPLDSKGLRSWKKREELPEKVVWAQTKGWLGTSWRKRRGRSVPPVYFHLDSFLFFSIRLPPPLDIYYYRLFLSFLLPYSAWYSWRCLYKSQVYIDLLLGNTEANFSVKNASNYFRNYGQNVKEKNELTMQTSLLPIYFNREMLRDMPHGSYLIDFDWLVSWLVSCLAGWGMACRLDVGWLASWFIGWLAG